MMTQLKTLTLLAVCSAMDLLLHSKDKTSTLEVKLLLRDMGFDASQNDVSSFMNDAFNDPANVNKYKRELVGDPGKKYQEYSLTIVDNSTPANDHGTSNTTDSTQNVTTAPNITINGSPSAQGKDVKEMPKFVVDKDKFQTTVDSYKHKNDWIVNKADMEDSDNYAIFDEKLTRDKVRSRFATINGIKINGVRARRILSIVK
jgi:hypothetical protein